MDANELKELQAPVKRKYRETPESAAITLRARGSVDDASIAGGVFRGGARRR